MPRLLDMVVDTRQAPQGWSHDAARARHQAAPRQRPRCSMPRCPFSATPSERAHNARQLARHQPRRHDREQFRHHVRSVERGQAARVERWRNLDDIRADNPQSS
jgi:hypothetical protein